MIKSQTLISLQREWYAKLKDEGFNDLEYFDRNMDPQDWLPSASNRFPLPSDSCEQDEASKLTHESTFNYYRQASVLSQRIKDPVHSKVLELHSDGLSLRQIAKQVGFSHPKVLRIVNSYMKPN